MYIWYKFQFLKITKVQFAFLIVDVSKAKCFSNIIIFGPIFEVCRGQMKFVKIRVNIVIGHQMASLQPHSLVSKLNALARTTPAEHSARDRPLQFR
jgi:hypothetical protein